MPSLDMTFCPGDHCLMKEGCFRWLENIPEEVQQRNPLKMEHLSQFATAPFPIVGYCSHFIDVSKYGWSGKMELKDNV